MITRVNPIQLASSRTRVPGRLGSRDPSRYGAEQHFARVTYRFSTRVRRSAIVPVPGGVRAGEVAYANPRTCEFAARSNLAAGTASER